MGQPVRPECILTARFGAGPVFFLYSANNASSTNQWRIGTSFRLIPQQDKVGGVNICMINFRDIGPFIIGLGGEGRPSKTHCCLATDPLVRPCLNSSTPTKREKRRDGSASFVRERLFLSAILFLSRVSSILKGIKCV